MKVLKVIHGYPKRYNAGSEVYSQMLCQGLADAGHEVQVFTREENPFKPDGVLSQELDSSDSRIFLNLINLPKERNRYKYSQPLVDQKFKKILQEFSPDVVHIGHLNHLSLSMIDEINNFNIPIVYTLHDYWLMCPRGQFLQRNSEKEVWALCEGQEDKKCAEKCYSGYFSGIKEHYQKDVDFWENWVARRMEFSRRVTKGVDLFIAPAQFLRKKYIEDFGLEDTKVLYMDYGFNLQRLKNRERTQEEEFTFGYIGTHIPAKGIQHLIRAFDALPQNCKLKIWGRSHLESTNPLKAICDKLPAHVQKRIEWLPEYRNEKIVEDVFNHVDAIVVPSIWYENSPLVIHEAQQVGVPVITANSGGMAEYVHHEVNGLLFEHRKNSSLKEQMNRFLENPSWARKLGNQRYLFSKNGDIPCMKDQVRKLEGIYRDLIYKKQKKKHPKKPGPWRITFDTNPDDCNLRCIMCEGFSPYSKVKDDRIASGQKRRRMDIALVRKVLEESKDTPLKEIIPSTMGEPLVYKYFEEILEMCHEFSLKLNLTTNGTFPKKGAAEWAKLIVPVTSDVKISWNAATKETQEKIMLGSNWEKVLDNLKVFIGIRDEHAAQGGNRCRVTLQLTFLQTNVRELADVVKLALDLGVDRIKGHHLWAHFKEIKDLSMRRSKEAVEEWNKAALEAQKVAKENLLPNGKKIILENIYPLAENAHKELTPGGTCPFLGKEAWINTEGRFSPCCAPDKQRLTLGDFGNINDTSLSEIWESESYQNLQKTYLEKPLCISCNMRKPLYIEV